MVRWVVGSILHGVDMVRAFAHGAMGRRIDPSWDGHGKSVRSWCDGSLDRSFMGWTW